MAGIHEPHRAVPRLLWDDGQMVNLGIVNADDFQSAAVDLNVLGHAEGTPTLKNGRARRAVAQRQHHRPHARAAAG